MRILSPKVAPIGGVREADRDLAIDGLTFLTGDDERLALFLAVTGLAPDTLRSAATTPGFLGAALDHIAGDDTLIRDFAAESGRRPDAIMAARDRLTGRDCEWVDP